MPPRISRSDQRLVAAYAEAAIRIERLLRTVGPTERIRLLGLVEPILQELEILTKRYVQMDLPKQFVKGSEEAIARLERLRGFTDIDTTFSQLHREAIQKIADEGAQSFGKGIVAIRENVTRLVSRQEKAEIIGEIMTSTIVGESPASAARNVAGSLRDDGLLSVTFGGKRWSIEHYASMLTNTIVANAHNTGAATRYASNGVEFGRRIERADAPDEPCRWMRNKIVWLGEPRFVEAIHPNCMGSIVPYQGDTSEALMSIDDERIPEVVRKALSR